MRIVGLPWSCLEKAVKLAAQSVLIAARWHGTTADRNSVTLYDKLDGWMGSEVAMRARDLQRVWHGIMTITI